jgi:hypothetical protein
MTMSVKPLSFYASSSEPLNDVDKAYFRARLRRKVHGMILKRFSELSENDVALRALLADRLGIHRSQVTRWLASPSNLTLDTLSDLMLGMNREIELSDVEVANGSRGNYSHPTSTIGDLRTIHPMIESVGNTLRIADSKLPPSTGSQATVPQMTSK